MRSIERSDVRPDDPLRLNLAAKIAFPDGSMSASGLRREAARGHLVIERMAGKDYTTLQHIERMRQLCRVKQNDHDSGCDQHVAITAARFEQQSGSSSTVTSMSPQDALRDKLMKRKSVSLHISPRNTSQSDNATTSKI